MILVFPKANFVASTQTIDQSRTNKSPVTTNCILRLEFGKIWQGSYGGDRWPRGCGAATYRKVLPWPTLTSETQYLLTHLKTVRTIEYSMFERCHPGPMRPFRSWQLARHEYNLLDFNLLNSGLILHGVDSLRLYPVWPIFTVRYLASMNPWY